MIIPLFALAVVFLILIFVVGGMGVLISIQLYSYGGSFSAFLATAVFWGGFALVLLATWNMLGAVDWMMPLLDFSSFLSPPI